MCYLQTFCVCGDLLFLYIETSVKKEFVALLNNEIANHSFFILKHFLCSFRACLKKVHTSDANLVGKIFFNIVQTKCFVLKPTKKCVRTGWWDKCQKYKVVKQAILRDNLPY